MFGFGFYSCDSDPFSNDCDVIMFHASPGKYEGWRVSEGSSLDVPSMETLTFLSSGGSSVNEGTAYSFSVTIFASGEITMSVPDVVPLSVSATTLTSKLIGSGENLGFVLTSAKSKITLEDAIFKELCT